ncbi:helix-turn-helix transcriptional regulator [Saccharothrix sp. NRRL B-16314]|uniref:helix-turn-helix transcriptional regulator n=1 Tax=Saccharothrix sp. NRRL B-16314 TaxID=1463825 RepID=UPI0005247686|nr:helix-turn-helix transcriptional regulator [Saccharothrix sp. NRRL B-16314]
MTEDRTHDQARPAAALLADEIKRRRNAAGLSQPQLAQRIGYTRQYVSLAERPGHNLPSLEVVKAIDEALGADGHLIALREQGKAEQRRSRKGNKAAKSIDLPATALDVEPWVIADNLTRSGIDGAALDNMEKAAYAYAQRYPAISPDRLWPAVSGQITRINEVLSSPQPLRLRRRAVSLLGVLTGIAGNLCFDLNRHDQAGGYFDVAELAALEAESPDLAAWVFAVRSLGPFFTGDYRSAVDLLVRADHESNSSSPRRRAWVNALLARAAAALGGTQASLKALDAAYRYVGEISDPQEGTDFFDAVRLDGIAGTTYLLLRQTGPATSLLRAALERRAGHDVKGRALLALDLAECLLYDDEPVEAARMAITALDWADEAMIEPILTRAQALRVQMVRSVGLAGTRSLDARLREVARG